MSQTEKDINSHILIVEDDLDQMGLLVSFAQEEIQALLNSENTDNSQKLKISNIKIITASNIGSLEKAVKIHNNVLLAILDCNIPDTKGGIPHDQFIKTGHKITGQHRTADLVTKNLVGTPVTMISTMNRFQRIVTQYYESKYDLHINFINKKDITVVKNNIGYYLRQYIK